MKTTVSHGERPAAGPDLPGHPDAGVLTQGPSEGVRSVATRRLIDAVATLDPADRALLNLWINRALPDPELLRLTRLSPDALAIRRERIVERLGETLGLPAPDVTGALGALATRPPVAAPPAGGEPPAAEAPPAAAKAPPVAESPALPSPSRRARRPVLLGAVVLLAGLIAVVVVLAVGTGGSQSSHPEGPAARLASPAAPTAAATAAAAPATLAPLPGGSAGARGAVSITRRSGTLTLDLRVSQIAPAPAGDHLEAWLYASVIDSVALGPIDPATGRLTARLPPGAARYPWIDVSVQPAGTAVHSGISVLRSPNPLAGRG